MEFELSQLGSEANDSMESDDDGVDGRFLLHCYSSIALPRSHVDAKSYLLHSKGQIEMAKVTVSLKSL